MIRDNFSEMGIVTINVARITIKLASISNLKNTYEIINAAIEKATDKP